MKQDTAAPRPSRQYRPDEYFAFVEASESLDILARDRRQALPAEWDPLLIRRWVEGRGLPTRVVWLDCVHASYFHELPWRGEDCDLADPAQIAHRRRLLAKIEPHRVVNLLLLLDVRDEAERTCSNQLPDNSWHRIRLDGGHGLPVLAGIPGQSEMRQQTLAYLKPCSAQERAALDSVFNPAVMDAPPALYRSAANDAGSAMRAML